MYPSFHFRIVEDNIFRHKKADRKSNAKGSEERRNMSFESIEPKMKFFFGENIFETDKINQKAQQRVAPTRCCIPERLQIHQLAKWRIEKIDNWQDKIPGAMYVFSHLLVAKVC